MKKRNILIVAAHPDDEVLGCGGTISRLINEGYEVFTIILGEGITSRNYSSKLKKKELQELKNQMYKANKILGVRKVFNFNLKDNQLDTIPLLEIVKKIEKIKNEIKPEIIFTHYKNDLNIDHKITYDAVITATRPVIDEPVKTIYSFEILSSTEWNYPLSFSPNFFFDITKTISKKIEAMKIYKSEIRDFPHPRSLEGIKLNAKMWGLKAGLKFAEAFQLVRCNA